jgi:outer membrane biosynthesis protein TonB
MLRLIFTMTALLALLFVGAVWLAAQPSGSEVREVVAPLLSRGFEMAGAAGRRIALTPTAAGIWEPEREPEAAPASAPVPPPGPEAVAARAKAPPAPPPRAEPTPRPGPAPRPPPTLPAQAEPAPPPEPEEEEIVPWTSRPFAELPLEEPAPEPPPDTEVAARAPDQDDWAALIRRMLAVHARVSAAE